MVRKDVGVLNNDLTKRDGVNQQLLMNNFPLYKQNPYSYYRYPNSYQLPYSSDIRLPIPQTASQSDNGLPFPPNFLFPNGRLPIPYSYFQQSAFSAHPFNIMNKGLADSFKIEVDKEHYTKIYGAKNCAL